MWIIDLFRGGNEMHLLKLNKKIRKGSKWQDCHMQHITLVKDYATHINRLLGSPVNRHKLGLIALTHDVLKENYGEKDLEVGKHIVPGDLNAYVKSNADLLVNYIPKDFILTCDLSAHAMGAAIFIQKEYDIQDPEIIYPVLFHSLPVIEVYRRLDPKIQTMIDIIMLSDKLSSNWLRINLLDEKVRCDLDQIVFGKNGAEFNYTLGLVIARLIASGKTPDYVSDASTLYYYHRLKETNPLIRMKLNRKVLGEKMKWPKRPSAVSKK
jgi:hypothetical protein